jgi:hypothetical protein
MSNNATTNKKFKSSINADNAPSTVEASKTTGVRFKKTTPVTPQPDKSKTTDQLRPYKLQEGDNLVRFLPQPVDSVFENYFTAYEYSIYNRKESKYLAYFTLDDAGAALINQIRKLLFFSKDDKASPADFSDLVSKDSKNALHLKTQPRVFLQGFLIDSDDCGVKLFKLPGTYQAYKGYTPQIGAGTKIITAGELLDINGNPKYGDVIDVESGRVINILVVGTPPQYIVQFEDVLPLISNNVVSDILNDVKPFDALVHIDPLDKLLNFLSSYLPELAVEYLITKGVDLNLSLVPDDDEDEII